MDRISNWILNRGGVTYNCEELSIMELLGKTAHKTNEIIDKINEMENSGKAKVSYDDMREIYKHNLSDFVGSWHGIEKPQFAEPGIAGVVDKLVGDVDDINNRLDGILNIDNDIIINVHTPMNGLDGAIGDGVTDETETIQAILDYAYSVGKIVYMPKTYKVSSITTKVPIIGSRKGKIVSLEAGDIIKIAGDYVFIENMSIEGEGTLSQRGIVIDSNFHCEIVNCFFNKLKGTDGRGVYITGVGTSQYGAHDGTRIHNCTFYKCTRGIDLGLNAEYITISDCTFQDGCGWAIWTISGNTLITGCNICKCQNGIYVAGTSNGAHSVISGCNINHCFSEPDKTKGYALFFQGVNLGEIVTGVSVFDGHIMIQNSKGICLTNCILGVANYNIQNSTGCEFNNCYFYKNYGHNILNSNSMVEWKNNKTFDGLHGASSDENNGGVVLGSIPSQSLIHQAGGNIGHILSVNGSANYSGIWDGTTSKATNKGYGGNRLRIEAQFCAGFNSSANFDMVIAFVYVGEKAYCMNKIKYSTNLYFGFSGTIYAEPNEEIYIKLLNTSGVTASVIETNGRFNIEGL